MGLSLLGACYAFVASHLETAVPLWKRARSELRHRGGLIFLVDVDLRARAQELVALDEQMQAMREDLVQEQKRTAERVVERTEAVKMGEPIQDRGMFGEGGGRGGRQRGDSPEGERPKGEKADKPKTAG